MRVVDYFSASYAEARRKFLEAAAEAGAEVSSFENPEKGPDGGALFTDVARLGPKRAKSVFITNSATHGIEGYCGSGCQIGFLRERLWEKAGPDTAIVVSHALNPYGFAWGRRVTEDNVDLNRNFMDHDAPHPENPAYDEIHGLLVPVDWDGPAREAADGAIARFIEQNGIGAFQAAVSGGQYGHADGLFYGGAFETWSNRTWRRIIKDFVAGAERVAFIDYHTGLGPYGYGEPIYVGAPDGGYDRARAWYGDEVTSPEGGTSTSAIVQGVLANAFEGVTGDAELTPIALEYGTLPVMEVLTALRGDNWLHLMGDVNSELGRAIKAEMRRAFYGETDDWKQSVFERAQDFSEKALAALAS